jgi:hypothetical protein
MAEQSKFDRYFEELWEAASKHPFFDADSAHLVIEEAAHLRCSLDNVRATIACPSTDIDDTITMERLANTLSVTYQACLRSMAIPTMARATSLKHISASMAETIPKAGQQPDETEKEIFGE